MCGHPCIYIYIYARVDLARTAASFQSVWPCDCMWVSACIGLCVWMLLPVFSVWPCDCMCEWVSACIGLCMWLWLQATTTANSAMTTANFISDNCQFTANFSSDHWQFSVCRNGCVGVSELNCKESNCQVSEHLFVRINCKSACVFCDCLSLCALDRRKSTRCERVSL